MNGTRIILGCTIISAVAAALSVPWDRYISKNGEVSAEITTPTMPEKPSIDCNQAATWAEISICSDQRLARLDRKLDQKFYELYQAVDRSRKTKIQSEQRIWISNMRECEGYGDGVDCLIRKYSNRLQSLDRQLAALNINSVDKMN